MKNRVAHTSSRNKQGGYALLLVVFLLALLVVGTMSIGLRVLTQGQREKEQEMIWRGKQYTRGIKLYYRKLGRFPTSMDDLVKPKVGNLRFMRQAYKDPMNKEDGSWRLIYVGPAGNLIGSLKPPQGGIQMPVAGGQGQMAAQRVLPLGALVVSRRLPRWRHWGARRAARTRCSRNWNAGYRGSRHRCTGNRHDRHRN